MKRISCLILLSTLLMSCSAEEEQATEPAIRGLKTVLVAENELSTTRRFPGVLEPSERSTVAFETGGRLKEIDLRVGQIVSKDEVLAELDSEALEIQVASAEAAVEQARVAAQNSADNLERQEKLLKSGTVTRAAVDTARTNATSAQQALVQAERGLDSAKKNASNTQLLSPIDGVISSVEAQSFTTISAGTPIVVLYPADGFRVSFTVNYDTVSRMTVGKKATLRLADAPDRILNGVVTELGASADTVSSFPVVISVLDAPTDVKSGMAVEVSLEFELPAEQGFVIPISAAVIEGKREGPRDPQTPSPIKMFVYDEASQTVKKREVLIAGIRENSVLVVDGLKAGERVASAGVSFLSDGQSVKLLEN